MYLRSLATAVPPHSFTQAECWRVFEEGNLLDRLRPRSAALVGKILKNGTSGIERRNFALDEIGPVFNRGAQQLNEAFERDAPARGAARRARQSAPACPRPPVCARLSAPAPT